MNDAMGQFERRLSEQPLRKIPAEWRGEILAVAGRASGFEARKSESFGRPTISSRLALWLWPSPQAWAGLAAVWVLILGMDVASHDRSPATGENSGPPTAEMLAQLKQQQRVLAELMGARESNDADRSKISAPRPRTGRVEALAI